MAPRFFLELFAGGQGFAEELRRQGFPCLAWRGAQGGEWDLLRKDNQHRLLGWARDRRLLGVTMTPPAVFWRQGGAEQQAGDPSHEARRIVNSELVRFACMMARVCRLAGVPWALHAPSQGSLFRLASVQRLIGIRGTPHLVNDACMWRAKARRRWSSLVWGIDPCLLSRPSCPGSKRWHANGLCHTGECVRSPPRVFLQALAVSFAAAALEARANRFETLTVSRLTRQ